MEPLTIRVGLANPNSNMAINMEQRAIPVLVSANSLFDHENRRFREPPPQLMDLDVALDSAGFVAMAHYKRYPWTVAQYVDLAMFGGFTWWSQMDCCCEPQIAQDRESVQARVFATAQLLSLCRREYLDLVDATPALGMFNCPPMPIVQGWEPDDYKLSVELANGVLDGEWPEMIGVGSVCRRHLNGPAGLWRVLHALDSVLPPHVRLHLFGVKGPALRGFPQHPRVVSVDSMAFEFQARIAARAAGVSKTISFRIAHMEHWLDRQTASARSPSPQLALAL